MSFQVIPASARAIWIASAPICTADVSNRPKGCSPTPMIATSFIVAPGVSRRWRRSGRLEGERHDLVALGVGGERDHGQRDVHTEPQLCRIALRETPLDADDVAELHQAHPERPEVRTGGADIGRARRESLRGPGDQPALAG